MQGSTMDIFKLSTIRWRLHYHSERQLTSSILDSKSRFSWQTRGILTDLGAICSIL
uniref:Predicted protein n=1 Tax=Hordeum vulgare subsp. vulgare TaxID=112509 RepID=F2EF24_HORVV|nr:predicted protein [Hordeum vulgare subsp. vulgare]